MDVTQMEIAGAFVFTPRQHRDARGIFLEQMRADVLTDAIGHPFALAQANVSVSTRGVVRGIHYAQVPPGQAKYVTCAAGRVVDYAIDLRLGSPTFGEYATAVLDDVDRRAVYLPEGVGHAFVALSDEATVSYSCTTPFDPMREHGISVFDPELGLHWPDEVELVLSDRDRAAPTLAEVRRDGLLPTMEDCQRHYDRLAAGDLPSHAGSGQ
jgi:dTDP-4-dehydrorhamnose 3,5-epimerase